MDGQTRIGVTRGINYTTQVKDESRMFVTDFTTLEAERAIAEAATALKGLTLFETSNVVQAYAVAHEENLKKLAEKNLDLFLYAVKAALSPKDYFENETYQERLPKYVADAVDADPEGRMPVLRHMLRVWPRTEYWCVVSNILSRAYALVRSKSPESAADMYRMLCDPYKYPHAQQSNWQEAMNAMMDRAGRYPEETEAQFAALFRFLNVYGRSGAGKDGIMIPEGVYTGAIRNAFDQQDDDMQHRLCEMKEMEFYSNPRRNRMLGGMRVRRESEKLFADVLKLKRTSPDEAKQHLLQKFKAFSNYDWDNLNDPQVAAWLGDVINSASIGDKQVMIYKLTLSRRKLVDDGAQPVNPQVHAALGKVLTSLAPTPEEGEKGEVLAECARMFAIASEEGHRNLDVNALKGDMLNLIERHAKLENNDLRVLDGADLPGNNDHSDRHGDANPYRVWPRLLSNYSLQRVISAAMQDRIAATDLNDADQVRRLMDVVSKTYAAGGNEANIQYAIPHEGLAAAMKAAIGYRIETRCVTRDFDFMFKVFGRIVEGLQAVMNQNTYKRYYFDIVTALMIYYASLNPAQSRRLTTAKNHLEKLVG